MIVPRPRARGSDATRRTVEFAALERYFRVIAGSSNAPAEGVLAGFAVVGAETGEAIEIRDFSTVMMYDDEMEIIPS
jgi:hypothetical protein